MKNKFVRYLPYCGVFAALTMILTLINFTLPIATKGCLVHLGVVMVMVAAYFLPPAWAGVSVALGMALYDMLGGWLLWSPFTFVIRFFETYIISRWYFKESAGNIAKFLVLVSGAAIAVVGYYLAEVVLYGNWIVPLASMPAELILNAVGFTVGGIIVGIMKRIGLKI
jgi:uncharacterized membrane protein